MKLLDTTFLIDLLRGDKNTLKITKQKELFLTTQINMYEVIRGMHLKNMSPLKIHKAIELFENIRVLPLDDNAILKSSEISARLIKKGETISDCDCLITGIALSKGIKKIITRNVKHFKKIDELKVENY